MYVWTETTFFALELEKVQRVYNKSLEDYIEKPTTKKYNFTAPRCKFCNILFFKHG